MTLPPLPARLRPVLELVPEAAAVADIGAGHGALAAHLAATGRRVIATELGAGAYAELCANLRRWGADEQVEARRGPEVEPLVDGEVDGIVVAGLGADTLLGIAAAAQRKRVAWLVLQCVQNPERVEPWLRAAGWRTLATATAEQRQRTYATWLVRPASGGR